MDIKHVSVREISEIDETAFLYLGEGDFDVYSPIVQNVNVNGGHYLLIKEEMGTKEKIILVVESIGDKHHVYFVAMKYDLVQGFEVGTISDKCIYVSMEGVFTADFSHENQTIILDCCIKEGNRRAIYELSIDCLHRMQCVTALFSDMIDYELFCLLLEIGDSRPSAVFDLAYRSHHARFWENKLNQRVTELSQSLQEVTTQSYKHHEEHAGDMKNKVGLYMYMVELSASWGKSCLDENQQNRVTLTHFFKSNVWKSFEAHVMGVDEGGAKHIRASLLRMMRLMDINKDKMTVRKFFDHTSKFNIEGVSTSSSWYLAERCNVPEFQFEIFMSALHRTFGIPLTKGQ